MSNTFKAVESQIQIEQAMQKLSVLMMPATPTKEQLEEIRKVAIDIAFGAVTILGYAQKELDTGRENAS